MDAKTPGTKFDKGKPRMSLLPDQTLWQIISVLEHGAAIHGAENWRNVEGAKTRYYDAAHRHLAAWRRGDLIDADTGHPTLIGALCSIIFLNELDNGDRVGKSSKPVDLINTELRSVHFSDAGFVDVVSHLVSKAKVSPDNIRSLTFYPKFSTDVFSPVTPLNGITCHIKAEPCKEWPDAVLAIDYRTICILVNSRGETQVGPRLVV